MRWHLRADMTGAPTQAQIEQIAADDLGFAHFNDKRRTAQIQVGVEADDYTGAVRKGLATFARLRNTQQLIADGVLSQPFRITVETEEAARLALGVLATKEVGTLLGMSDARVRQLKDSDPLFPRPVPVPGAAGDFYREIDVAEYRQFRQRGTSDLGRPRAADEALLEQALMVLGEYPALGPSQRERVEIALANKGGRYVHGKAKLLVELHRRLSAKRAGAAELGGFLDGHPRFDEALLRAKELWPDQAAQ